MPANSAPINQSELHAALHSLVEALFQHQVDLEFAKTQLEARYILKVLERHNGNISQSARSLGIHRNTLAKRIRDLDVKWTPSEP